MVAVFVDEGPIERVREEPIEVGHFREDGSRWTTYHFPADKFPVEPPEGTLVKLGGDIWEVDYVETRMRYGPNGPEVVGYNATLELYLLWDLDAM